MIATVKQLKDWYSFVIRKACSWHINIHCFSTFQLKIIKLIQVILYGVLCSTFLSVKDYFHGEIYPIWTTNLETSFLYKLVSSGTFIYLDILGAVENSFLLLLHNT